MTVTEETPRKIVLVDESGKSGLVMRIIAIVLSGVVIAVLLRMTGFVSSPAPGDGELNWWPLVFFGWLPIAWLLGAFLHSYSRVVIDKDAGQLRLERIRYRTPRVVRSIELTEVRRAVMSDLGETWSFGFELKSGEILEPRKMYSDYSTRATVQKLTERVNQFLGTLPPHGHEI